MKIYQLINQLIVKEELNQLFEILDVIYPGFKPTVDSVRKTKKMVWFNLLQKYDFKLVEQAREKIIDGTFYDWKNKMVKIISTRL